MSQLCFCHKVTKKRRKADNCGKDCRKYETVCCKFYFISYVTPTAIGTRNDFFRNDEKRLKTISLTEKRRRQMMQGGIPLNIHIKYINFNLLLPP